MEIKNYLTLRKFSPDKMQKLNLHETARFFCDVYCLEPGQAQKPHLHEGADKLYAVIEGEAFVSVGDETERLGPGDSVLCPSGLSHGLENRSAARAAVLAFMAPRPEKT